MPWIKRRVLKLFLLFFKKWKWVWTKFYFLIKLGGDTSGKESACQSRILGLPRWLRGKESTCTAGDSGSIAGLKRSPGERNGNPLPYSYLGNPTDRGPYSPAGG